MTTRERRPSFELRPCLGCHSSKIGALCQCYAVDPQIDPSKISGFSVGYEVGGTFIENHDPGDEQEGTPQYRVAVVTLLEPIRITGAIHSARISGSVGV